MTAFTSSVAFCSLNTVTFVTSVGAMVGGFGDMYYNFKLASTGVIMYPREPAYYSSVTLTAINGTSLKCIQYLNPTSVVSLPTNITNLVVQESTRFFSCNNNYFIGPRPNSNSVEKIFEKFSVTSGEDLGSFQLSNNDLLYNTLETCDEQDFYSTSPSPNNDIFKSSTGSGLRYHTTSILSLS